MLTQGDPAGIGPELLLQVAAGWQPRDSWRPILILERAVVEVLGRGAGSSRVPWEQLRFVTEVNALERVLRDEPETIPVLDPVARPRTLRLGQPSAADARGALAALDAGFDLVRGLDASGQEAALVTAPLGKEIIAKTLDPTFRGHTDYLARRAGLESYGRDYLMAFLAPQLRVALLSTHLSLRQALDGISIAAITDAVRCLARSRVPASALRIGVAGVNPHAGEGGLMGREEIEVVAPAVAMLRQEGLDVRGPESPDTVFVRARRGELDWVLALYHDQGLIAVKTAGFGEATNWTMGLPFLRTSVDHGTAYALAGSWRAEVAPMQAVIATTLQLLAERREPRT